MDISTTSKPLGQDTSNPVADSAYGAIGSTQSVDNPAFDRLADKVESAGVQAQPLIKTLSSQAESTVNRSVNAVRDISAQLRETGMMASDSTAAYVKEEPLKAILIAAATGAALMALVKLMSRSRNAV
jgi:ElaB/YqjD/DUF883 family membrane-anchored ribosome-binding protein